MMNMMRRTDPIQHDKVRKDEENPDCGPCRLVVSGSGGEGGEGNGRTKVSHDDNDRDDASHSACAWERSNPSGRGSEKSNSIALEEAASKQRRHRHPRDYGGGGNFGSRPHPPGGHHVVVSRLHCTMLAVLVAVALNLSWMWLADPWRLRQQPCVTNMPSRRARNRASSSLNSSRSTVTQITDNELIASPRPPLHELIGDFHANVTGDVSWLMDFALLGHSKCATTAHLEWLRRHPDILMHQHEIHSLTRARPAEMVSMLYTLPNRPNRKRGYKAPTNIRNRAALDQLRRHWPNARLVVGVRHPVKWFESYYNFMKIQSDSGVPNTETLGPAETMAVPELLYFHHHLSLLGKTNVTDPGERSLLGKNAVTRQPLPMPNRVFLYESTQPYEPQNGYSDTYRHDLETFLGLSSPLPPIRLQGGKIKGNSYNYTSPNRHYALDVCDDKYAELRGRLVQVGAAAAGWILTYFVNHPDVTVSSPRRFEELVKLWSVDPCEQ